jgi:hypothetical protein
MEIERDKELLVWALSPERARRFMGVSPDAPVRVVKEAPETESEKRAQRPDAKLYAIRTDE